MRILLTGFNKFGGLSANPSQTLVETIATRPDREGILTEVLQTEYLAADARVRHLIRSANPEAVIGLGADADIDYISLERFALNVEDSEAPDNAGRIGTGQPIVSNGPAAYRSTLPLKRFRQALLAAGIPVRISNHAGTFVCNRVFYASCHEIGLMGSRAICGFIHVPLMPDQIPQSAILAKSMPLEAQLRALEDCLGVLTNPGSTELAES